MDFLICWANVELNFASEGMGLPSSESAGRAVCMLVGMDPFRWFHDTQNWFAKTERSSGFRPYLIFFLILVGFSLVVFAYLRDVPGLVVLVEFLLAVTVVGFILIFGAKCFHQPDFCRSELHVERMLKISQAAAQTGKPEPVEEEDSHAISNSAAQPLLTVESKPIRLDDLTAGKGT